LMGPGVFFQGGAAIEFWWRTYKKPGPRKILAPRSREPNGALLPSDGTKWAAASFKGTALVSWFGFDERPMVPKRGMPTDRPLARGRKRSGARAPRSNPGFSCRAWGTGLVEERRVGRPIFSCTVPCGPKTANSTVLEVFLTGFFRGTKLQCKISAKFHFRIVEAGRRNEKKTNRIRPILGWEGEGAPGWRKRPRYYVPAEASSSTDRFG